MCACVCAHATTRAIEALTCGCVRARALASDFTGRGTVWCRIGGAATSAATFVTTTRIKCATAAQGAGSVAVVVSNDNVELVTSAVTFLFTSASYTPPPSPALGPAYGGATVTLTGVFGATPTTCRFGTSVAAATAQSATEVACDAGGAAGRTTVSVSVSYNGRDFVGSSTFTYLRTRAGVCLCARAC